MDEELWQVNSHYFCAGIILQGGKVTMAAPILKWMIGKTLEAIKRSAPAHYTFNKVKTGESWQNPG